MKGLLRKSDKDTEKQGRANILGIGVDLFTLEQAKKNICDL